jgi:hypothetical protein
MNSPYFSNPDTTDLPSRMPKLQTADRCILKTDKNDDEVQTISVTNICYFSDGE